MSILGFMRYAQTALPSTECDRGRFSTLRGISCTAYPRDPRGGVNATDFTKNGSPNEIGDGVPGSANSSRHAKNCWTETLAAAGSGGAQIRVHRLRSEVPCDVADPRLRTGCGRRISIRAYSDRIDRGRSPWREETGRERDFSSVAVGDP